MGRFRINGHMRDQLESLIVVYEQYILHCNAWFNGKGSTHQHELMGSNSFGVIPCYIMTITNLLYHCVIQFSSMAFILG